MTQKIRNTLIKNGKTKLEDVTIGSDYIKSKLQPRESRPVSEGGVELGGGILDNEPLGGRIQLQNNPEEIDCNFSFSGTDNGIAKMTETVPLDLESFNYHLRLHNVYSPLADTQESTDDV
ncbi:hypothetical protein INT48_001688 [Thamnidium elegans]|uniref:Uncharacterized protein n=1 Tax=Thamnidium elegans TaxID=101142 RepID=A0A8H7SPH5_9FUNG|nr:hypothetical protein INT48_001688 [Thamnidium elegans]